jgi:type III pantothenate kinase
MNLVIDTGNTRTKLALFQGREMVSFTSFRGMEAKPLMQFCEANPMVEHAIVSTVKEYASEIDTYLQQRFKTIFFSHQTPIPVINRYATPATLGKDRLAAVIGSKLLFPGTDNLVIDAGTAITFDLLTAAGEYMGGSISPGIEMRYNALHTFTSRLPLLNATNDAALVGTDTASGIHSGVLNGALAEMEGIIQRYQQLYPSLKIILTGGDHNYFDKRLKIKTFAAPNLVLEGLNLILEFNIGTH